jgi:hypothetical protein
LTPSARVCGELDKYRTVLPHPGQIPYKNEFWDLKYRADVSDRWSIRAHLSKLF